MIHINIKYKPWCLPLLFTNPHVYINWMVYKILYSMGPVADSNGWKGSVVTVELIKTIDQ